MSKRVHIAFERRVVTIDIVEILPRRIVTEAQTKSVKYRRIASSIPEVGIIEPLPVARLGQSDGRVLLLDGHLRLHALQALGHQQVNCVIEDDDEGFTYNKRVNRLATIQEHYMIEKALKNGVSEVKLAKALNVDIKHFKRRRSMLDGICPEVVEMLKDKIVNPATFDVLRKMKPLRQVEAAELMATAANWSSAYVKALLAATRQDDLANPDKPKKIAGMSREQMARMEREMDALSQDFKQIENSYGDNILHLVVASGYLSKLVGNREIERYLAKHHSELLAEFRSIIAAASLDSPGLAA